MQVINKPGDTRGDKDQTEDGDRNWPLVHVDGHLYGKEARDKNQTLPLIFTDDTDLR